MEKFIQLKTPDDHLIYGVINKSTKVSNTLVIFVHGLTGHFNEHIFHSAARFFPKKGLDVFRFALYAGEDKGRNLTDCTITTHAMDLNIVVKHFRRKYKTVVVVGHSLGSPTILMSDTSKIDVVVLWEPSYLEDGKFKIEKVKLRGRDMYIEEWGVTYLINPGLQREWIKFDGVTELPLIQKLNKPLKIILGGKGILLKGGKKYFEVAKEPKSITIIKNATHCFDEGGTEESLLEETLNWIKKFSKKS